LTVTEIAGLTVHSYYEFQRIPNFRGDSLFLHFEMRAAGPIVEISDRFWSVTALLLCLGGVVAAQSNADTATESQRLTRVAETAEEQNRFDDAIKAYETIAIIGKNSPPIAANALLHAGQIYMVTARFDKAASSFRSSISIDPGSAEAHNALGEALGELKQYQSALRSFQEAVNLNGSFVRARYNIAVTYDRLGQLKYAEFVYRILIRDHPDYPLAYDGLGVVLSKSGRAREAIAFHQKAISLNPRDPSFYYNSAISYLLLGDVKNALEQKQQLEKLDPAMAERLAMMIAKQQK